MDVICCIDKIVDKIIGVNVEDNDLNIVISVFYLCYLLTNTVLGIKSMLH